MQKALRGLRGLPRKINPFRCSVRLLVVILVLAGGIAQARSSGSRQYLVFVGTYTNHGSQGIYSYRFNAATGKLTAIGLAAQSENPAFLALDPTHRFLYASNEINHFKDEASGAASAFAIDRATGKLSLLNEVSTHDPGPAHIAVDRTGKDVLTANYALGSVTVLPVLEGGKLGDFTRLSSATPAPALTRTASKGRMPTLLLFPLTIVLCSSPISVSTR